MAVRSLFPILLSRDLPQLVRFYEAALGAVVVYRFGDEDDPDYVSLQIGEVSLGIGRDPDALPSAPTRPDSASGAGVGTVGDRIALWFYVDDVDAVFAAWLAAGGRSEQAPADMPWGERVAQVRDPEGTLVNLGAEAPADSDSNPPA
ncbi:VOC family protein [Microbacterium yannicii]|uniref:VOC family protein n=1 Tax=Microbacterium yannicii TaxID=671622 RepID=UPI0003072866|nr:VOC family protein [Microbacterium yannicii]